MTVERYDSKMKQHPPARALPLQDRVGSIHRSRSRHVGESKGLLTPHHDGPESVTLQHEHGTTHDRDTDVVGHSERGRRSGDPVAVVA
jgi:hypothetical protein